MSGWRVEALAGGGHRVVHHDHETGELAEVATVGPETTVGDLVAWINDRAADGDYLLLPDSSLTVILDAPEPEAA